MAADAIDDIRAAIRDALSRTNTSPLIVAIDGHSGAGKTTLAAGLASSEGACVVAGDDFYRVMDADARRALNPAEGADQYIDWQRLRAEALIPLNRGLSARYLPYDWDTDRLAAHDVTLQPAAVVILEGVYSARPELADLVSLSVLVDTPLTLCRARVAERGDPDGFWDERWLAAELVYFSTVRPADTFDVIVRG